MDQVILTIYYHDVDDRKQRYSTDSMHIDVAMERVMQFASCGVDVISHYDTGRIEMLLLHRVTGIHIGPAE